MAENPEANENETTTASIADSETDEQAPLPAMPPPGPPSLKRMALLMAAVDKIYPVDDYGVNGQWTRFHEICNTTFKGGVHFYLPVEQYNSVQRAKQEAENAEARDRADKEREERDQQSRMLLDQTEEAGADDHEQGNGATPGGDDGQVLSDAGAVASCV